MPGLILGMDGAEPPPADAAVGCCRRFAGLSHRRNRLTGPLEAPGISLVRLLQHILSSCGQYTPSSRRGVPVGICYGRMLGEEGLCVRKPMAFLKPHCM